MSIKTMQEWNEEDKIAAVYCVIRYPNEKEYLEKCAYNHAFDGKTKEQIIKEGKKAFRYAKKLHKAMNKKYTDEEILNLLD